MFINSRLTVLLFVGLLACSAATVGFAAEPDAKAMITRAGNAEDEKVRYQLLKQVLSLPELETKTRQDLEALLPILDYWANETYRPPEPRKRAAENGFLCGFFIGKVGLDKFYLPRIEETSPLYPVWCLYRGRLLIHQVIQSGNLRHSLQLREAWCGEGRRLLSRSATGLS